MRTPSIAVQIASWAAVPFLLTACVTPNIHKTNEFAAQTGVQTLSIDAKQRVVIFAKIPNPHPMSGASSATTGTTPPVGTPPPSANGNDDLISVTCAEPSPDALSALSTSVGGSIQDPKVIASFAVAASESAASIGLRTQSIQLLRDGMYRSCEAYAARAIDGPEFNRQQRRYQNLMLSLLAIEQLTGAVVARQVGLGDGAAGAAVGENADQAAADATAATNAVGDAQKALTTAQATQASDKKACEAAAPDTTNAACTKAADDQTAVDQKTAALDTAKKKETTAKMVLQSARGAVTASAAGAHVSFSDAPKSNGISDTSARYVAEATRTIVSTTLLASFAQEECARLWDVLDRYQAHASTSATPPAGPKSLSQIFGLDQGGTPPASGSPPTTQEQMLQRLFSNCSDSQQTLLNKAALFTPDYGAAAAPALMVLGTETAIPMPVDGAAVDLRIIGGTPPFEAVVAAGFKAELEATIPPAKGSVHTVHIDRPKGASKTGPATVTVVDANNVHVDIAITLSAAAAKAPVNPAVTLSPPTNVKAKFAGGKFIVTFTPPKAGTVDSYLVTATGTDSKKPSVLSAPGSATAKSIDTPNCVDGEDYTISVEAKSKSGESARGVAPGTTPCSAVTPPPAAKAPAPPTGVKVTASAGGKFTVAFVASKDDGGGAITKYTVSAKATTKGSKEPELKQSAADAKAAISLSPCKAKEPYDITVVATRGTLDSTAAKDSATCLP